MIVLFPKLPKINVLKCVLKVKSLYTRFGVVSKAMLQFPGPNQMSPVYVFPGYRVTLCERVDDQEVSTDAAHQMVIDEMTIGQPEGEPFQFPALVSEAEVEIHVSVNLAALNILLKQPLPENAAFKTLSFITMKGDKNGRYQERKIAIASDASEVRGNTLVLDASFRMPDITTFRNHSLWTLSVQINELWIKNIAIDIAVFPSYGRLRQFCNQKEINETNELFRLSPFWYTRETIDGLNRAKGQKRPRDTLRDRDPSTVEDCSKIVLGYVPPVHNVILSKRVNSEYLIKYMGHHKLVERMKIETKYGIHFPAPFLVRTTPLRINLTINLAALMPYCRNSLDEQPVKELLFYQQNYSKHRFIHHTIKIKRSNFCFEQDKLHLVKNFSMPNDAATLGSKSLWNLAVKVYGIWILEVGIDFAVFTTFQQLQDFCYHQEIDPSNTLFQLSPYWYQPTFREYLPPLVAWDSPTKKNRRKILMEGKVSEFHEECTLQQGQAEIREGINAENNEPISTDSFDAPLPMTWEPLEMPPLFPEANLLPAPILFDNFTDLYDSRPFEGQ